MRCSKIAKNYYRGTPDYIHMKSENIVGIIRNTLCDAYNSLSNKNLFDTKATWLECGISYRLD